jgi:hypothetical protein
VVVLAWPDASCNFRHVALRKRPTRAASPHPNFRRAVGSRRMARMNRSGLGLVISDISALGARGWGRLCADYCGFVGGSCSESTAATFPTNSSTTPPRQHAPGLFAGALAHQATELSAPGCSKHPDGAGPLAQEGENRVNPRAVGSGVTSPESPPT